jgi:hypothetical protein
MPALCADPSGGDDLAAVADRDQKTFGASRDDYYPTELKGDPSHKVEQP